MVQVFDPDNLSAAPVAIELSAEEPRAMAVSADRTQVFVAAFESGNGNTILNGRLGPISTGQQLGSDNVISRAEGPYGGRIHHPTTGMRLPRPSEPATRRHLR